MNLDKVCALFCGMCLHEWKAFDGYLEEWSKVFCVRCKETSSRINDIFGVNQWSSSLNGEISYEVRKWFQEYEPDVWKTYLEKTMYDLKMWPDILNAQLSIQNFYDYLVANWQEWGYEECPLWCGNCVDCREVISPNQTIACKKCNGTGCICKYPEAEKIIKGEK